jgi:hypothetical protein
MYASLTAAAAGAPVDARLQGPLLPQVLWCGGGAGAWPGEAGERVLPACLPACPTASSSGSLCCHMGGRATRCLLLPLQSLTLAPVAACRCAACAPTTAARCAGCSLTTREARHQCRPVAVVQRRQGPAPLPAAAPLESTAARAQPETAAACPMPPGGCTTDTTMRLWHRTWQYGREALKGATAAACPTDTPIQPFAQLLSVLPFSSMPACLPQLVAGRAADVDEGLLALHGGEAGAGPGLFPADVSALVDLSGKKWSHTVRRLAASPRLTVCPSGLSACWLLQGQQRGACRCLLCGAARAKSPAAVLDGRGGAAGCRRCCRLSSGCPSLTLPPLKALLRTCWPARRLRGAVTAGRRRPQTLRLAA